MVNPYAMWQALTTVTPDAAERAVIERRRAAMARVMDGRPLPPVTDPIGACARNVLAKLATVPVPPLIDRVEGVVDLQVERIYVQVDTAFVSTLSAWSRGPDAVFACEGKPRSPEHQRLLAFLAARFPDVTYQLVSFRELVTFNSLQCVVAVSSRPGADYADCDIDLGGALTDVVGFIRHQEELAQGGVTDHLALRVAFLADPVFGPLIA